MRYLVVVLDEEIGGNLHITDVGVQVHPAADPSAEFNDVKIYMGYCASDQLVSTFEDNYVEGSRTQVFDSYTYVFSGSAGEWCTIQLDTPFTYWFGQGNLLIEVTWSSPVDNQSFYTYGWDTGIIRAVAATAAGAPSVPTGSLSSAMSRLKLVGDYLDLESTTFAGIKILQSN